MLKEIIVNVGEDETRVAVLENRKVVEIYIERSLNQRLMGNIYKGRVENVLPGMQAAFVDIGIEKNAFLYIEDALTAKRNASPVSITDILKLGQEIIVQVTKEPTGTKGPRVTTHLTIPGRYLVLMPTVDYIGISRRIDSEKERERLKMLAGKIKPKGMGLIVRTLAEGITEEEMQSDIYLFDRLWRRVKNRLKKRQAPALLHRDIELVQRILRDNFSEDIDRLLIDSRTEYEKVIELVEIINPGLIKNIILEEREDVFKDYGIEQEFEKALNKKVWLKCGGYLIIDQAEALTVIDVNTGKFTGTKDLEDTVHKTNMEAAVEIARQLRLRSMGGIIIVDFIDMSEEEHREEVLSILAEEIKKDKVKTNILGLTQLGLVEMTRKKVRPSLADSVLRICPYCDGRGRVFSEETMSIKFKSQIRDDARSMNVENIVVDAHPAVAARLIGTGGVRLRELESQTGKTLFIRGNPSKHIESICVRPLNSQEIDNLDTSPVRTGDVLKVKVEETHVNNEKDGIARLDGFVLDIEGAGFMIGKTVPVKVSKVYRTYAKAKLVK